jgi:hypothetical protein
MCIALEFSMDGVRDHESSEPQNINGQRAAKNHWQML